MPNQEPTPEGARCHVCKGYMLEVNGCKPTVLVHGGKEYPRIKVGDPGDFYENGNAETRCTDCGAKFGYYHHSGCDCEICAVCGGQLLSCNCDLRILPLQ